ncbi:MAG: filamentous hemagglutinin N-terminal domain-containing protein [Candidatus Accumulibacter sp.]|nr:filamentous hemagglutinin N-terminal domain-containing protein [Accumulibacter sp.]
MNHTYRLVWNSENQRHVPAPESARAHGKGDRSKPRLPSGLPPSRRAGLRPVALLLGAALAQTALAQPPAPDILPDGGRVVAGQAGIAQSGNRMTVTQGSDKAIINWQHFDIGRQAGVTFAQPSAGAVALNRVVAGDASQIHGQLTANGQIWLINPNGVIFGAGSRVDVGGLVASTLASTNEDFLAGQAVFTRRDRSGHIVNQGEITAADGGLIALLAPSVRNEGVLRARLGNIALAAGERITLASGADGRLALAVTPATVQTLVDNKQLIVADGGQVIMTAKAADALAGAVVANSGTVRAQTLAEKQGRLLLLADMEHGEVKVGGTLDASAPASASSSFPLPPGQAVIGNGGFIETSAARVTLAPDHKVTTAAARGRTGTWLIDPNDYTIAASGGDISGSQLSTDLVGSNVVIQSSGGGTAGQGDIHVNDPVAWSSNTLTLTAARDININAVMTASGTSSLVMNTGTANGSDGAVAGGTVKVGFAPGEANGFAGRVDFPGRSGNGFLTINGQGYTVINSLGEAGSTTGTDLQGMRGNLSGYYALGNAIEASATSGWNGGAGFEPVGRDDYVYLMSLPFVGVFDGLGHTINGLTINRPTTHTLGLYGVNRGSIRNVGQNGGSVTGVFNVGGLVGQNDGIINNAYATGSVTGNEAGGLVGWNNGTINSAYATGSVTGVNDVGGLVGSNKGPSIKAYESGCVTG